MSEIRRRLPRITTEGPSEALIREIDQLARALAARDSVIAEKERELAETTLAFARVTSELTAARERAEAKLAQARAALHLARLWMQEARPGDAKGKAQWDADMDKIRAALAAAPQSGSGEEGT